jgi:hypothetical protein
MSAIPLHLQRRFEQRWAVRFGSPVPTAPKNVGVKGSTVNLAQRQNKTRAGSQKRK